MGRAVASRVEPYAYVVHLRCSNRQRRKGERMRAHQQTRPLLTSEDVWDYLCRNAGLDIDFYDAALECDLRKALGVGETGDLRFLLREKGVSTERFLSAFFEAAEPYAQMMSELLRMFERAAAQRADRNIAIEFDFGADLPQLDFDISSFRQWMERWQKVCTVLTVNLWSTELLWRLAQVLQQGRRAADTRRCGCQVASWIAEYDSGRWPAHSPPPPESGKPELDERLKRVWRLWETVLRESGRFGNAHEDLSMAAQREKSERRRRERPYEPGMDEPPRTPPAEGERMARDTDRHRDEDMKRGEADALPPLEAWPATTLQRLNAEQWARTILIGSLMQASFVASHGEPEAGDTARRLVGDLDKVFHLVDNTQMTGTELLRILDDFLSLPVWQRRHELFSAWVSTQILDALESESVRIHQYEGLLEFSFSGTHVATLDALTPRLHLWAEMRSPLASPVGKDRRAAIQPDYSLVADPVTNPLASVLEVECKQYRRPSLRNFSAALTDYARGRPNAVVLLVNYGRSSDKILPLVADDVRDRTHILGNFRPGEVYQLRQFRQVVAATVSNWKEHARPARKRLRPMTVLPEQIILRWDAEPRDLDLHLFPARPRCARPQPKE